MCTLSTTYTTCSTKQITGAAYINTTYIAYITKQYDYLLLI